MDAPSVKNALSPALRRQRATFTAMAGCLVVRQG